MVHLAVLIANPRQEIQAADLVAGLAGLSGATADAAWSGPAQPVLDDEAIAGYRNHLKRLDAEIGELESGDDPGRAASLVAGPNATGWSPSCPTPRDSRGGRDPSPTSPSAPASPWARPSAGPWPGSPKPTPSSASTCGRRCAPACAAPTGRADATSTKIFIPNGPGVTPRSGASRPGLWSGPQALAGQHRRPGRRRPSTAMKSLAHPARYWSAGRYWPGTEARSEPPGRLATSSWTHSGLMSSSIAIRAPA